MNKPTNEQIIAGQWECKGIIAILKGIGTLLRNMSYEWRESNRAKVEQIERTLLILVEELESLSKS